MENSKPIFKRQRDNEYKQCWESWRFFLTFRSTLLVFSFSITSGLLLLYFKTDCSGASLDDLPKFLISILGLVFTYAVITVQGRNKQMYTECLNRAMAIELDGSEPPEYHYGEDYVLEATVHWLMNKLKREKSQKEFKNKDVYSNHLATSLNLTPVTLLSWMTVGIQLINLTMFLLWFILLGIVAYKYPRLSALIILILIVAGICFYTERLVPIIKKLTKED